MHLDSPYCADNIIFWLSATQNMISLYCIVKVIFRIMGNPTIVLKNIYDFNPFLSLRLSRGPA